LQHINADAGSAADLHKLDQVGRLIRKTCLCGLGLTAANPVLTYLHHFEPTL
jgi:NADH:ubiquinone oxidoreductase subunit F (NADH-binding)